MFCSAILTSYLFSFAELITSSIDLLVISERITLNSSSAISNV